MSSRLIPKTLLRVILAAGVWLFVSQSAIWSANACPVITNNPACATKCPGESVTFSVTAGPAPLGYQWRKNGTPLAGATSSSYSITSVSSANAGSYSVVVSNALGTATSTSATLTVNTVVTISALADLVRSVDANAVFSTSALGTGPFHYVWDKGGAVLSGQTTSSLVLTNLALEDAGVYRVTVSGACGSASSSATLTVNACFPAVDVMLVIDRSGSMSGQKYTDARQACSNFVQNLNFSTNADQAGLASYCSTASLDRTLTNSLPALDQAIHSIPAASGNTSISLGLQTAQTELLSSRHNPQALPVLILLSDGLPTGSDTKSNALYVATQAKNAGTLIFTIGLGSDVDPVLMAGIANSPSDYFFTANSSQLSALFNAISTVICRPPTNIFVTGLSNLTVCAGSPASFSVAVSATSPSCAPYSYQWQKDGVRLSGQTNTFLVIPSASVADAGVYAVQVTSVCRCATNSATLTVNQDVVVASAPVSVTNCPGTSATFNVSATGTGLSYQWYKGASPLPGQTGSSLVLSNVSASDAGIYCVVMSAVCGNAVTNSASLTVNQTVLVTSAPVSVTNCAGTRATFSVNATGTGLSYQWFKGASPLVGQTSSSLVLNNVSASDAGTYGVVVTGLCGNALTNSATLTVNQNVLVAGAPVSVTNCPGTSASFNVNATGTGLSYQWYKGASPLAGQTGSSLVLNNVSAADAGTYGVVVIGLCGNAVTNSATLTVNRNAVVAAAPVSVTNCPGTSASFNVSATGTGLNYQWCKNNSVLAGQTGSSLVFTNVTVADGANYSVVVSGACGNSVTNSALLVVNAPVQLVTPLVDHTNCAGATVTFAVTATGTGLSYHWYRSSQSTFTMLDAGTTGSSLTLNNVSSSDAGTYSVVITGICGDAITNSARLVVNSPALVVTPPVSQTNCPSTSASFNVNATGSGLGYQWYKGPTPLLGQTGSSLVLNNVGAADAGTYSVVVSGVCGNAVTNSASLIVNQNVAVASAPVSVTNCPGTSASFNVNATGTGLDYQWYKSASPLAGQTGSSLVLANVSASDAGAYSVVVGGLCGNAVTNSASLTVNQGVVVVSAPVSLTNCPGTTASFSVNATGTALNYQWYKGGTPLPGQTSSKLALANVGAVDTGAYSVVVSGVCGSAVTNSASLTVNSPVLVAGAPVSLTNCPGTSAGFNVSASGTGLNYQWYKGASPLPGQTGSSLVLNNVSAADAGTYSVVLSGTCGSAVTNSAALTVNQSVLVASAPVSVTNCPGTAASFNVNATGTGLSYQWYKSNSLLAGQTGSSLVLNNVSGSDAGTYSVVLSGTCGSAVTNSAALTVNQSVLVTRAPVSVTNCPGTSASFTVSASGTGLNYQWYKGASPLPGQTGSSLVLSNVSVSDAGAYSLVVSGVCGSVVTNSASLTMNQNVVVTGAPLSLTNCPGTSASFNVSATGTGLNYQWCKGASPLPGQTASSLTLGSVSATDAGTYSVIVSGACTSVVESATLTVNANVGASPLANLMRNRGDTAVFSTAASGSGPFNFAWKKNGAALPGQTSCCLTLTNLSDTDAGLYSVEVGGRCTTAVQSASLAINQPPTVTILSPTNGAFFLAPGNFAVLADARDVDGTVTNVEFFAGTVVTTNSLGQTTNAPYFILRTNLPPGIYSYIARATDNMGAMGTSAPVTITVLDHPSVTNLYLVVDQATSLFMQKVRATNPTYSLFKAVRIYISGLPANVTVYNASGYTNGVPYVQMNQAVPPGSYVDFTIEYYTTGGATPNPTLRVELIPPDSINLGAVSGFGQFIYRSLALPNKTFLLEFATALNRLYYVQYSSDLVRWQNAEPAVPGTGGWYDWLDNGLPNTESAPAATPKRFYRVILLP